MVHGEGLGSVPRKDNSRRKKTMHDRNRVLLICFALIFHSALQCRKINSLSFKLCEY